MSKSIINTREEYETIKSILEFPENVIINDRRKKYRLFKKAEDFTLVDGDLYLKCHAGEHKKVIPASETGIMHSETLRIHNTNHMGQRRLSAFMAKNYHFIRREIIKNVVSECTICISSKPLKTSETFKNITANKSFDRFMLDLIDLRTYKNDNNGFCWLLTLVDVYTKFAQVRPLKCKSGQEVADALRDIIYILGPPKIIQCDNGKEFCNNIFNSLAAEFKIKIIHGRPRHPQSQGQVERFNQTVTRYLSKKLMIGDNNNQNWIDFYKQVVYEYNYSVHNATNKSPFNLIMNTNGFNSSIVQGTDEINLWQDISSFDEDFSSCDAASDIKHETELPIYDNTKYIQRMNKKNVHCSIYNFIVGDKVIIAEDFDANDTTKRQKLQSFFSSPGLVVEILSENRLKINIEGVIRVVSMRRVKKIIK